MTSSDLTPQQRLRRQKEQKQRKQQGIIKMVQDSPLSFLLNYPRFAKFLYSSYDLTEIAGIDESIPIMLLDSYGTHMCSAFLDFSYLERRPFPKIHLFPSHFYMTSYYRLSITDLNNIGYEGYNLISFWDVGVSIPYQIYDLFNKMRVIDGFFENSYNLCPTESICIFKHRKEPFFVLGAICRFFPYSSDGSNYYSRRDILHLTEQAYKQIIKTRTQHPDHNYLKNMKFIYLFPTIYQYSDTLLKDGEDRFIPRSVYHPSTFHPMDGLSGALYDSIANEINKYKYERHRRQIQQKQRQQAQQKR